MKRESAVEFAGASRVHIGLGVQDLEESIEFYRILLDQKPAKVRKGYAKFEVAEPSLNLTLNQVKPPFNMQRHQEFHYGIQIKSTEEVYSMINRFSTAGLEMLLEEGVTCCYAVQDKVWVTDPDGHKWEVVVLESDSEESPSTKQTECCANVHEKHSCSDPRAETCCV